MFNIGEQVSFKYRHPSIYLFNESNYDEYAIKGVVVKTPSHVSYDAVAVMTADRNVPLKIVPTDSIVGYQPALSSVETHKVVSGSNTYIVTVRHNNVTCSCTGFQFRKYCKHSASFKK